MTSKEYEMCPIKYPNVFRSQRIDQTNTQIYLDAKQLTEQISEYFWIKKASLFDFFNIKRIVLITSMADLFIYVVKKNISCYS